MIIFDRAHKNSSVNGKGRVVLSSASLVIASNRRIALFSHNSADTSHLVGMLTGMTHPSSGRIIPKVKVSFPVGHLPGYDRVMTIAKNVEHIGHLYGMDVGPFVAFVRSTLKIGAKFDGYYPALTRDERRALAYVVAFSIPFDIYVLTTDKIRAAYKCMNLFKARRHSAGMIIPISAVAFAEEHCDASMVLHNGELQIFETVAEGHRVHVAQKRVAKAGVPR